MPSAATSLTGLFLLLGIALQAGAATPATQPAERSAERARVLKEHLGSFSLHLAHHGDQEKPYYQLTLSTQPVPIRRSSPFAPYVQISEAQAGRIIDHLAADGFLERAIDATYKKLPAPPSPCYTLTVSCGDGAQHREFYAVLGWKLPLLERLDALRPVLEGDSARQMDLLLGRLSGHRREWENEAQAFATLLARIRAGLPKGWEFTVISERGRMGHPHGLGEPLFRIDFTNPAETFVSELAPNGRQRVHPSMRLHFHAIQDKPHLMKVIEAERVYSWDIPIHFAETKDYLIVTSPPWINGGRYTDEARQLVAPLERALKAAMQPSK